MIKILYTSLFCFFMIQLAGCKQDLKTTEETAEAENVHVWETWEECGQDIGDHPCDFTLKNQNGEEVSLYDFYGQPIILDLSTMWCGYCQVAASEVQNVKDSYSESNLEYITVLVDNLQGEAPTVEDADEWSQIFGIISAPVLAGSRDVVDTTTEAGWLITGWPTFYFITDEMVVHNVLRGYSESGLISLVEDTIVQ